MALAGLDGHIPLKLADAVATPLYHKVANKISIKTLGSLDSAEGNDTARKVLECANRQVDILHLKRLGRALQDRLIHLQVSHGSKREYDAAMDDLTDVQQRLDQLYEDLKDFSTPSQASWKGGGEDEKAHSRVGF